MDLLAIVFLGAASFVSIFFVVFGVVVFGAVAAFFFVVFRAVAAFFFVVFRAVAAFFVVVFGVPVLGALAAFFFVVFGTAFVTVLFFAPTFGAEDRVVLGVVRFRTVSSGGKSRSNSLERSSEARTFAAAGCFLDSGTAVPAWITRSFSSTLRSRKSSSGSVSRRAPMP